MPAGSTYSTIATTTASGSTTTVTFSSIPQTYTDLVLVYSGSSAVIFQSVDVRLNSDTGSNYSFTALYGDGSTAQSFRVANSSYGRVGNFSTGIGNAIAHFQNYSNTTTNKTLLSRSNDAGVDTIAFATLWRNTAAINTILIGNIGGVTNISAGSTFTLYGISAA